MRDGGDEIWAWAWQPGTLGWVPLDRPSYEGLLAGADVLQQCIWEVDGKDTLFDSRKAVLVEALTSAEGPYGGSSG